MSDERPALFLDRDFGRYEVASVLRQAGEIVEVHDDHFAQDVDDEDWLPEVTRRGWIAISKDNAIRRAVRRGFLQRLTVAQCGARLFIFTGSDMTGPQMGAALAKMAPKIRRMTANQPAPFIATAQASGNVVLWRDRVTLLAELARLMKLRSQRTD